MFIYRRDGREIYDSRGLIYMSEESQEFDEALRKEVRERRLMRYNDD